MSGRPRLPTRLRSTLSVPLALLRTHRTLILTIGAALGVSVVAAALVPQIPENDRIIIGNTAGTLTSAVEVNGYRVLVGAGPTRSHAADFIGRSTRPWSRDIDLLVVPGWDDSHAVGALGLLERRSVRGIAVLGVPGDDPTWTLLERRAERDAVPLRMFSSPHRVSLARGVELRMAGLDGKTQGAWVRLDYQGMRVDFVDADSAADAAPPAESFQVRSEHILVNMQDQSAPAFAQPALLIQQMPFWREDFREIGVPYVSELDRNERVQITLDAGELRIPLQDLEALDS